MARSGFGGCPRTGQRWSCGAGDDVNETTTHYSSVRPPGGAWGAPQVIVSKDQGSTQIWQFEFADNGTAAAVWTDTAPDGTFVSFTWHRNGTWGPR